MPKLLISRKRCVGIRIILFITYDLFNSLTPTSNSQTAAVCFHPDNDTTHINGENGWYIPRINGTFYWMDMKFADLYFKVANALEALTGGEEENVPVNSKSAHGNTN